MYRERKLWWARLTEKLLVFLILLIVGAGVWFLIANNAIPESLVRFGVVTLGVLLVTLLFVQFVVDRFFDEAVLMAKQSDTDKFRSLYERSPTPLITVDPKGGIQSFNAAAVKLFETTTDRLGGNNFFDFILAHTGHDASMLPSKLRVGVTLNEEELALRTLAGNEIWVLMSVYEDKRNTSRIISLIDITQSKRIDTAKSEFVALATHQLRTPIAAIRWNFDLLQRKLDAGTKEVNRQYLDRVARNIMRMIALIDDFLSVSKLEMGTFATTEEEIDLKGFFESVLDEFKEKITEKNIQVTYNGTPEGFIYRSDSRLFHIIVSNLVSNAVKYMKQDGRLGLSYQAAGHHLIIHVTDTGIGIPRTEIPQLFKRFFRASNARSHQTEGTGLGLYIVKESAEQLGGTVEVESIENTQTTFTVTLPI